MKLDVTFTETDQKFQPDFGQVFNVSDGGFERGYDKGYGEGETAGYDKGYGEGYAEGGEAARQVKFSPTGMAYVPDVVVVLPDTYKVLGGSVGTSADPEYKNYPARSAVFNAPGVIEGYAPEVIATSGHYPFAESPKVATLRKIVAPKCTRLKGGYYAYKQTELVSVQFGSIGYPVTLIGSAGGFTNCTNNKLVIEIYVDAISIADIPVEVTQYAPWGATNATVIYRNATTGEVITA